MLVRRYQVSFVTPAFVGNARQDAQWRTPPFKALLRQWARVAWMAGKGFKGTVAEMREWEGMLLGNAWLSHSDHGKLVSDMRKSRVRLRLLAGDGSAAWGKGSQRGVSPLPTGLDTSYAWFGLIKRGGGEPDRTAIKADQAEGVRQLSLAIPEEDAPLLERAVALMHAFGTLGCRSRGGWGSLHVDGADALSLENLKCHARPVADCLKGDWGMSLALDQKGLCIWESKDAFKSWDRAMRLVATERRHVRSELGRALGKESRVALGFAEAGRMPSPLRWKVARLPGGDLQARVFAMPHAIAADARKSLSPAQLQSVWNEVCRLLDADKNFRRMTKGA